MNVYKGKEERLKINELSILFKSWKEKPNERENIKDERITFKNDISWELITPRAGSLQSPII